MKKLLTLGTVAAVAAPVAAVVACGSTDELAQTKITMIENLKNFKLTPAQVSDLTAKINAMTKDTMAKVSTEVSKVTMAAGVKAPTAQTGTASFAKADSSKKAALEFLANEIIKVDGITQGLTNKEYETKGDIARITYTAPDQSNTASPTGLLAIRFTVDIANKKLVSTEVKKQGKEFTAGTESAAIKAFIENDAEKAWQMIQAYIPVGTNIKVNDLVAGAVMQVRKDPALPATSATIDAATKTEIIRELAGLKFEGKIVDSMHETRYLFSGADTATLKTLSTQKLEAADNDASFVDGTGAPADYSKATFFIQEYDTQVSGGGWAEQIDGKDGNLVFTLHEIEADGTFSQIAWLKA